ncbi:hypothetical protein AAVH_16443 [Aphelenchoides avenae]|nr:hypothetical protein AAVH_16443 [Aphelenchus avenae]
MRFIAVFLLAAFAKCAVAYQGLTEKDCETVGNLVEQTKAELLPQVDVILQAYVPSATDEDVRALKVFIQKLDGQNICERTIACVADFSCVVRRLLQGIGDTLFSVPELKVTNNKHCDVCQSSMPSLSQAYLQDNARALLKQYTRSTCAKGYSKKHCVQGIKWFDSHYEEFVRLLTASTTCEDLNFCRTDASTSL